MASPFDPILRPHGGILHPESYPTIEGVDSIAPHVAHNRAIHLFDNGPIEVLRYVLNDPEVFQTAWDLECRGLVFDRTTGALLSRPFHKFFTLASPEGAAAILEPGPVDLVDKLDGSMLGGLVLDGQVRLHTKAGFTTHAAHAEAAMDDGVRRLVFEAFEDGHTPIFERIGPDNRIVIAYGAPSFVLLALRDRRTGAYVNSAAVDAAARRHGVARPQVYARIEDAGTLWDWNARIGAMEGIEGAVVVGADGRRAKIKTRSYLSIHKALTMLSNERHAFRAVVEGIDDDVVPLLPSEQAAFFQGYAHALRTRMLAIGAEAEAMAAGMAHLEGAARAAQVGAITTPTMRPLVFGALKGRAGVEVLLDHLAKRTRSLTAVHEARRLFDLPAWDPPKGLFFQD